MILIDQMRESHRSQACRYAKQMSCRVLLRHSVYLNHLLFQVILFKFCCTDSQFAFVMQHVLDFPQFPFCFNSLSCIVSPRLVCCLPSATSDLSFPFPANCQPCNSLDQSYILVNSLEIGLHCSI